MGPYKILECVGKLAYRLTLPMCMDRIHNEFHVLLLRKYLCDLTYLLRVEDVKFKDDLVYEE